MENSPYGCLVRSPARGLGQCRAAMQFQVAVDAHQRPGWFCNCPPYILIPLALDVPPANTDIRTNGRSPKMMQTNQLEVESGGNVPNADMDFRDIGARTMRHRDRSSDLQVPARPEARGLGPASDGRGLVEPQAGPRGRLRPSRGLVPA